VEIKINSIKHGEQIVLIDDEDYIKISEYKWSVVKYRENSGLYAVGNLKNKKISMHRLLMGSPEKLYVDHIDHNTLDNRKRNLRVCNNSENNINKFKNKKGKTSEYKGVSKTIYNTYKAEIRFDKKRLKLGTFKNEDQAAIAYNIAALKYQGEFARPNVNIMMHKGFN
jgi:hypothetical protein